MAIYHMHAQVISRGGGRSVVAAIAYRAAEKVHDERLGQTFDYSRKQGVVHSEIMAPEGAPAWMKDRASLWNGADAAEKRKDAQMAREVRVALPVELSKSEQIEALRGFIKTQFVDRGMVADFSLHHDNPENPHAHILLTTREIAGEGFGKKCRDWNDKALYGQWREAWANHCNLSLQRAGHDIRIDHRSYAEQGIALEPTVNIGKDRGRAERDINGYVTQERLAEHDRITRENGEAIIAEPAIALDAITRQRATFTRSDIGRWLHSRTLDAEQFNRALSAVMSHESVVALGVRDDYGNERFTTEGMQSTEREMVDNALELHGSSRHRVDESFVEQAEVGKGLSDEQRAAVRHVLGRRDIAVVEGYAGAGKSRMLGVAREAWEAQGYRVVGAALAGKAAEGLEISAGISSRTLASYERSWAKGYDRLTKNDILVVDEAGMLGTEQMARVVAEVRRAQAKLVLVGDTQQLQAIDAGAPMRAIGNLVGATRLQDIRRQQVDWQRDASLQLAQGDVRRGLNAYHKQGHLHERQTQRDAMGAMVEAWNEARKEHPEQAQIMLAYRRQEVADLNAMARECCAKAGELGYGENIQTPDGAKPFAEGDRVYFLRNDRDLEVKNGSLGTVEQIKDGQMVVRLDGEDERRVAFDTQAYNALDHGYAATVHKAQGVTVDRAHVLASQLYDRNVSYVAMTRHTRQADMYWSQEEFSSTQQAIGLMQRERPKDLALDYGKLEREHERWRQEWAERLEVNRREQEQIRQAQRDVRSERAPIAMQEAPRERTDQERVERAQRMEAFVKLRQQKRLVERSLCTMRRTTFDEQWRQLPEVTEAVQAQDRAAWRLQNETRYVEQAAIRYKEEHPIKAMLGFEPMEQNSDGHYVPVAERLQEAKRASQAADERLRAVQYDPALQAKAHDMARQHNAEVDRQEAKLSRLEVAVASAEPQQTRDKADLENEAKILLGSREQREQRMEKYQELCTAVRKAERNSVREPVKARDVWLEQKEVRAAGAERDAAEQLYSKLSRQHYQFHREHRFQSRMGREPLIEMRDGRQVRLSEAMEEAGDRFSRAMARVKEVENDPKLVERAKAIAAEHNRPLESARRQLPELQKALRERAPQHERDEASQKIMKQSMAYEQQLERTRSRSRDRDHGLGFSR